MSFRSRREATMQRRLPILLTALIFAAGCSSAPPSGKSKPVEVIATHPITDSVTDYQNFTGRLDAVKTVEIRARVSGYVDAVPFKEGDLVKEGDLLFQIDPRTYQADYNQAVANHNQAIAELELQEKNIVRMKRLIGTGAIAQEDYDLTMGNLDKARASVGSTLAARDRAKLYLDFTRVTSPVTGRISRRFVDPGNLVLADNTMLTTVVTEDPMWAYFDVDERTYLNLVGTAGSAVAPGGKGPTPTKFPVWMELANETEFKHEGSVDFVDNRVNGNSGTIRLRGVFENPLHVLKSGLFVRIRLPIGAPYKAFLIPDEAVLSDQDRKYVWVVDLKNNIADYQNVELGQAIGKLRVIKKGLTADAVVVKSGMQRVKAKTEVAVTMEETVKPPSEKNIHHGGTENTEEKKKN
jgi:membrane fusion protein, multidrug efflux system